MVKGKTAYLVLGIVVVTAIILQIVQFFSKENPVIKEAPITQTTEVNNDVNQDFVLEGEKATSTIEATTTDEVSESANKLAVVSEPQSNSVISSPLVVKGEAPGYWFFEASFPVKLVDNDGNLIAVTPASAQSDPLTENFVPYKALLEFNTTATSGYLVLTNDNPSGLPEYELSVKIPVTFLNK